MANNRPYVLTRCRESRATSSEYVVAALQERRASLACRIRAGSAQMFACHRLGASTSRANALELLLSDPETPQHRRAA